MTDIDPVLAGLVKTATVMEVSQADYEVLQAAYLAELERLRGFVEEIRDHNPTIYNGRHNRAFSHPEDADDPLMDFAEFECFQDEAAKLIPKPPKAAKVTT